MADDKVSFLLDLDVKDFLKSGASALDQIKKIGDESNLLGLVKAFDKSIPQIAAVGVALAGVKKAIDFTVAGEEIERVNRQFEILSKQAGIAPTKLKAGLEESAKGLADTGTLLKIANESMVKIGSSAQRLPELMDIATKATEVYGGTATDNFKILSDALAEGNIGILKRYGLTVDLRKAQADFAQAQGTTVGQLSELEKRQAIFNAALDQGTKAFKDITVDTESATNTLQQMKTAFSDLGEIATVFFERVYGPKVREFLKITKMVFGDVKQYLTAEFGSGLEQTSAQLDRARLKVQEIEAQINAIKSGADTGIFDKLFGGTAEEKVKKLTQQLEIQKMEIKGLEIQYKDVEKAEESASANRTKNIKTLSETEKRNLVVKAQEEAAYQQKLTKDEQDLLNLRIAGIQNIEDVEAFSLEQRAQLNTQHVARLQAIESSKVLDDKQKLKLRQVEDKIYQQQIVNNELETFNVRKKMLDQYAANSRKTFAGIGAAFVANSQKMKIDQADMGKRGNEMWNSLATNATNAFTTMGAQMAQGKNVAQAAADAIKSAFLGMLGDRAIAEGSILLLSSIWPPNPLGIGAGAGLLALGGALKSMAGSSGGAGVSASSAGGGMSAQIQREQTQTQLALAKQEGDPQKEANLRRQLLEMEKEEDLRKIQDNKDLSTAEREQIIAQNEELYRLKRQQLENELSQDQQDFAFRKEQTLARERQDSGLMGSSEPLSNMETNQKAQRTVQVNIAGNYLETDQTKRMLMDLMRQETDATGFAYNQIGA